MTTISHSLHNAISLLNKLIVEPSFSKSESKTARLIANYLEQRGLSVHSQDNNVWNMNKYFDSNKPTILLNSHHDTVRPNQDYTNDPFEPMVKGDKLFGLGSNDAGGALVSLIETFLHFYDNQELKCNIILACTAEEEISGDMGLASILNKLPKIDMAIVGEPTSLDMAVAEKGLMVLDCVAKGKSGHAAREEGENAIYTAIKDIEWLKNYQFDKVSNTLGPIKITTSLIEAGTQHNVVPDQCKFVVDVRTTDAYTNEETLEIIKLNLQSEVKARSLRLNPSGISESHHLFKAGLAMGLSAYGSPTLSDQTHLDVPSIKLGPGDSARSHTADEFIYINQIEQGIETYIKLLTQIIL